MVRMAERADVQATNFNAIPFPIPRAEPVMIATRSFNSILASLFNLLLQVGRM